MSRRCHHGARRIGRPGRPPEWRPAAPAAVEPVAPAATPAAAEPAVPAAPPPAEPVATAVEGIGAEPVAPTDAATCTAPQLRRFIKSRAYVPMHELRRRFAINGAEDDVTPVDLPGSRVFVGLPEREGRMLGELLRGGDIGYELSFDPISPIVIGVYPMRPVPRS